MKNRGNIIAIVVLASTVGLSGCSTAVSSGSIPAAPAPGSSTSVPAMTSDMTTMTAPDQSMASMIHIESGAYRDAVPVSAGSKVSVMNMDTTAYTLTSDDGTSFSVTVPAGSTATFMAPTRPGSYPFHSDSNSGMHGTLTVH